MRYVVGLGILAAVTVWAGSDAHAYIERWSVDGKGANAAAADCTNCEEDMAILITCTAAGGPVELTVYTLAQENGTEGAKAPLTFNIDGEKLTYTAKTVEYGLVGFTPVVQIPPGDPLMEKLQAGRKAVVASGKETGSFGLSGSRAALDIFKAECGW